MGNSIVSFFSGVSQVARKLFVSGKSCNTLCRPMWDIECYIDNLCISNMLKLVLVAILIYFVLLFLYKLGICQCICHILWRTIRACFATYFSSLAFCCTYICDKLRTVKRRRKRDVEAAISTSSRISEHGGDYELWILSSFKQQRELENGKRYKDERLRRCLRPSSHRAHVEFSRTNSTHRLQRKMTMKNIGDHDSNRHHHIRVARSSRFSHKRSRYRVEIHRRRECAKLLASFHSSAAKNKLKAVSRKYSNLERSAVALFPPAKTLLPESS